MTLRNVEIWSDGKTVWVNGPDMLGRFNRRGMDVHVEGHCIRDSCRFGLYGISEWKQFQRLMQSHHDVRVRDWYMPDFLKEDRG